MAPVPPPGNPNAGQQVGPKQIYDELIRQGAGTIRAVGIMANMINESSLNVETGKGGMVIDNNGYPIYGLVSWNTKNYPDAGQLVTGDPQKDLKAQVTYLAQTGGFSAAKGATYAESAGNFAANYEHCVGCQSGGAQYNQRQTNAATVAGWVSGGKWPLSAGEGAGQAQVNTSTATQSSGSCAWQIGGGSFLIFNAPTFCIISKTQARALLSAGILVGGTLVLVAGVAVLVAAAGLRSKAADAILAVAGPAAAAGP